ncbi:unnamed protein product [Mytilus coruscus]|uniref:YqaJ viral recombinase domain-containing protein n=1 Tax=Mytilus coruscus TaxID=42192 RepID=A0A6J8E1I2_MYTCO|nr:unnamed protein product [Mytilus coruscus]
MLVKNLVKNLLYSKFRETFPTKNGLLHERSTIGEYRLKKAEENVILTVQLSGLIISNEHEFLAGSPDGIVNVGNGEKGLLEVKNLFHSKPINLFQAAANKNFCLEKRQDKLFLKQNHDYYYQCQGLLNVGNFQVLDFVVCTINPYQLFIQRIERDLNLWNNVMLPRLTAFYRFAILPELACPREGKSSGIREPGVWILDGKTKMVQRAFKDDMGIDRGYVRIDVQMNNTCRLDDIFTCLLPAITRSPSIYIHQQRQLRQNGSRLFS